MIEWINERTAAKGRIVSCSVSLHRTILRNIHDRSIMQKFHFDIVRVHGLQIEMFLH